MHWELCAFAAELIEGLIERIEGPGADEYRRERRYLEGRLGELQSIDSLPYGWESVVKTVETSETFGEAPSAEESSDAGEAHEEADEQRVAESAPSREEPSGSDVHDQVARRVVDAIAGGRFALVDREGMEIAPEEGAARWSAGHPAVAPLVDEVEEGSEVTADRGRLPPTGDRGLQSVHGAEFRGRSRVSRGGYRVLFRSHPSGRRNRLGRGMSEETPRGLISASSRPCS
ncbi:MAG: hypothetical protein ABEN55_14340 [Bradymonadaceae bacterium]